MLFKLSNLNSNLALRLGYLNPALNNSALRYRVLMTELMLRNGKKTPLKKFTHIFTNILSAYIEELQTLYFLMKQEHYHLNLTLR